MKFFRTVFHPIVILKFFGRLLLHGPPVAYLVMYLSLIAVFTVVFSFVRDDFYHSTVQYEPFIRNETEQILYGLKNSLVKELKKKHPDGIVKYLAYEIKADSLGTRKWKMEDPFASFVLYTYLPPSHIYWGVKVSFDINPIKFTHEPTQPGEKLVLIPVVLLTLEELGSIRSADYIPPIPVTEVFDTYKASVDKKNHINLPIPLELSKKIQAFSRGIRGRPDRLPGNIIRMLYLSAVTITTLGYGDIVPLTARARVFITLEAILGVILIGLFLNSLRGNFSKADKKGKVNNLFPAQKGNIIRGENMKDENPKDKLNKLRVFFAIIYFLISLIIIYFFRNKMFYFKVPENSWNYYRLLWCCSASVLGFSVVAFVLRNHEKSPLPEYLTHYPFQLLAIATLVFSILHIFDATSGYLFYYLSFSLCFTFSFLVDSYRGFIKSVINGFSK